jgi:drug/metabolite transporter (DMT)-like permease
VKAPSIQIQVLLFACLLTLDVSVQVLEKFGSKFVAEISQIDLACIASLLQQPIIWGIVVLSILQLVFWTKILRYTKLSVAYPITSLFFPLTILSSLLIFHEHLSVNVWLGAFLITIGVSFVGSQQTASNSPAVEVPEATTLVREYAHTGSTTST